MKKNFLLSVVLLCMAGLMAMAGSPVGKAKMVKKPTQRQVKVEGTYVAFFSDNGANASKWDSLWLAEAAKYVGKEKASAAVAKMKNKCNGTCIGSEAVRKFGAFANDNKDYSGTFQFDCRFKHGVDQLTFKGRRITGVDASGSRVFSHTYSLVGKDKAFGAEFYKSDDGNRDEFTYFMLLPDTPADTYHIELRYGSNIEALKNMRMGKYAYWMIGAVRAGNDADCAAAIKLYVEENLRAEKH